MAHIKAITCSGFGDPSVLQMGEVPRPDLKSGQVRIRVRASGVNRADILQRQGKYAPPIGESEIIGLEVAGDVIETAANASQWHVGDRVMALVAGGGYAEDVCVDEALVMPLSSSLSFVEGAAIPEAFVTAHLNLFTLGKTSPESTVLIHAGASGVGTAAIQMVRRVGARVFATVGSEEKADAVTRLGATSIRYRSEQFDDVILKETNGQGANVILDPIGASYLAANFRCLAVDGRQIQIGLMGGRKETIDLGILVSKRIRLIGSTLRALPLDRKRAAVAAFRQQFLADIEGKIIMPIIDKIVSAESVQDAHARMESNRNIGKIVLQWGENSNLDGHSVHAPSNRRT
jgi:tumor protein p53-inducible protein 3